MKSLFVIISLFLAAALIVSCEQDEATPSNTDLIVGNWTVSSFVKGNEEIAGQFSGYLFCCSNNGNMTIKGNGQQYKNCDWEDMNNNDSLYQFRIMGCQNNSILLECMDEWELTASDSLHCYFASHNPAHQKVMCWLKE